MATRTAATAIAPSTYVVDQPNGMCAIADPSNPAHRGKLLGLVVSGVAQGAQATTQSIGPISGVSGTFSPGDALYIGDGTTGRLGSIVSVPPVSSTTIEVWRQQVGTATTTSLINGLLAPAYRVPVLGSVAVIVGPGAFVVPTDAARAAFALRGRRAVQDASYVVDDLYSYIGLTGLSAPRTITLPAAATYPLGQSLLIVDESGLCSEALRITIMTSGSDRIGGPGGPQTSVSMAAPYQKLVLHSNGLGLWVVS